MDSEWQNVITALNHPDTDKRVQALAQLHSLLDSATSIPDADALLPLLKAALKHQNAHLSTAALACLPRFIHLLIPESPSSSTSADLTRALTSSTNASSATTANPDHPHSHSLSYTLKHAFIALLPLDKLGDSKERVRDLARETLVSAARASLRLGTNAGTTGKDKEGPWQYLETKMIEGGFHSKSAKAREQSLHYLTAIRDPILTHPLAPLRPFTPLLLPLLGDSDPHVRSLALSTTITIFSASNVTAPARADLKKAMIKLDVNKKVQETILSAVLGGGAGSAAGLERSQSGTSVGSASEMGSISAQLASVSVTGKSESGRSDASSSSPPAAIRRPPAPAPPSLLASLPSAAFPTDPTTVHAPGEIQPVYIASERDLAAEFEGMKAGFEGKETEHNWMVRDRSVARIRGMLLGNVVEGYREGLLTGVKSVQDGIIKTASSLRTTVAVSALSLIAELSTALGTSFDHYLDPYLSHCLSMAGMTKKIVATASQATVTTLIRNAAYHHRTLILLWQGMNDKIASGRVFVAGHVGTFVEVYTGDEKTKAQIEHSGGLDELEKCLKKGLSDANPGVKEKSRTTYWEVRTVWPELAERVWEGLDATSRKQLEKVDPSKKAVGGTTGAAAAAGVKKSTRPSVRELMMQAKARPAVASPKQPLLPTSPPPAASSPTTRTPHTSTPRSQPSTPTAATNTTPRVANRRPSALLTASTTSPASTVPHLASPIAPTPITPTSFSIGAGASESLLQFTSPFGLSSANRNGERAASESEDEDDYPSPLVPTAPTLSPPRVERAGSILLPVTEPIVDDALREQAAQAESAAERLLEIAREDQEELAVSAGVGSGILDRTPVKSSFGALSGATTFEDSPDVRNGDGVGAEGKGKGNWWMMRKEQGRTNGGAESALLPPDSPTRTTEIERLVAAISSLSIDASDLRRLSALSKERPILDDDGEDNDALASPTKPKSREAFWDDGKKFGRVWEGTRTLLLKGETNRDVLLDLLLDLVSNQLPAFAGSETSVFSLLLVLREDPSRSTIAAVEGISDSFVNRTEPLFSLGSLHSALEAYLASSPSPDPKSYALGLRLMGKLFERLPSEVLEDEIPRCQDLIKKGLNDGQSGDLRRAAVNAIVAAQSVLRDEQRLFAMIDGLGKDQLNLLSYYISKLPPA